MTLAAPWAFSGADTAPYPESWSTSLLLVQRGETELIVRELNPLGALGRSRYEGGFLDENTLVVGSVESDEEFGTGRHWLVDTARIRLIDQITYPFEVSGPPKALGDGTWYTASGLDNALRIWALS